MHGDGLADDEAIGLELADGLTGVGVGDFVALVGVEPDLALAAAKDGRRQALLRAKVRPREKLDISCVPDMAGVSLRLSGSLGGNASVCLDQRLGRALELPYLGSSVITVSRTR